MKRRKRISLTFTQLAIVSLLLIGAGYGAWYLMRRTTNKSIDIQPLPEGFYSHGIDVSHHQGEIDWDTFFQKMDTTISFVYVKATEGTSFVDSHWKRNCVFLDKYGMKHGLYHFFSPTVSGRLQADHFLKHYRPSPSDLPPVLDAEVEASSDSQLIKGMKEWLTIVEQTTGIKPIIYTSYSMYRDTMRGKFPGYEFWIASYNMDEKRVLSDDIIHWQYSDRGTIPGFEGPVDLNFSKKKFAPIIELAR